MSAFRVHAGSDGVLYLAGELDLATQEAFAASARERVNGQGQIVLDLTDLTFVDSTGIRTFIALARDVAPRRLVLRHPVPAVASVLAIVGLEGMFGIHIESST
jgi:anti-sigma B factor antagonist